MIKFKIFRTFSVLLLLSLLMVFGCSPEKSETENYKAGNNLNLGASAKDLLSDELYTSLKIEVAYVPGMKPPTEALDELKDFLHTYVNKPDGISVILSPIKAQGSAPYSIKEIVEIEKVNRSVYNDGKELAVFILFANGRSDAQEDNKLILGTAYRNTSMVIFEETIREVASNSIIISEKEVTSATLQHEFGHLFGLVDNGTPAQSEHMDSESKSHCNVQGCLMTSAMEFGKGAIEHIKNQKSSQKIGSFDEKCHLDLIANGGR